MATAMKLLQQLQEIDLDTVMKIVAWLAGGVFALVIGGVPLLHKLGFWTWLAGKCKGFVTSRRQLAKSVAGFQTALEQTSSQLELKVDAIAQEQQRVAKELRPNGGSSMRDSIDRMAGSLELIHTDIGYLRAKSRYLTDQSNECEFELDADGNLIYANCSFCTLIDADEKELCHLDWVSRMINADKNLMFDELERTIEKKTPLEIEVEFRIGAGRRKLVLSLTPRVLPGGELRGFFGRARAA